MVKVSELKPEVFINYCFKILTEENDIIVLEFILNQTLDTIKNFVKIKDQEKFCNKYLSIIEENFYNKFLQCKNTTVSIMVELIEYRNEVGIENLLNFLQKTENAKTFSLQKTGSEIIDFNDDFGVKNKYLNINVEGLTLVTKKNLLFAVYESTAFDIKTKNELLPLILKKSEIDNYLNHTLNVIQPNLKEKEKQWQNLIYCEIEDKGKLYAIMKGFSRRNQYHLLKKFYHEKFFEDFIDVKNHHSTDYVIKFFDLLNPGFIHDADILKQFICLKEKIKSDDQHEKNLPLLLAVEKVCEKIFCYLKVIEPLTNFSDFSIKKSK